MPHVDRWFVLGTLGLVGAAVSAAGEVLGWWRHPIAAALLLAALFGGLAALFVLAWTDREPGLAIRSQATHPIKPHPPSRRVRNMRVPDSFGWWALVFLLGIAGMIVSAAGEILGWLDQVGEVGFAVSVLLTILGFVGGANRFRVTRVLGSVAALGVAMGSVEERLVDHAHAGRRVEARVEEKARAIRRVEHRTPEAVDVLREVRDRLPPPPR